MYLAEENEPNPKESSSQLANAEKIRVSESSHMRRVDIGRYGQQGTASMQLFVTWYGGLAWSGKASRSLRRFAEPYLGPPTKYRRDAALVYPLRHLDIN